MTDSVDREIFHVGVNLKGQAARRKKNVKEKKQRLSFIDFDIVQEHAGK